MTKWLLLLFIGASANAWEVSSEALEKLSNPQKTPIEDLMPEPPPMVTTKPIELMTEEEKLAKAIDAFHYLQSTKVECQKLDVWLGDSTKALTAVTGVLIANRKLREKNINPRYFKKASLIAIAALFTVNIWLWLNDSERIWTVESWLGRYHYLTGESTGDQRAEYFTSSEQAYSEFLSIKDEREIRYLMTKNPTLLSMTFKYRELVRWAREECKVILKFNEHPILSDPEKLN